MRTEDEIKEQHAQNRDKIFPKGEYWEGVKEGYLKALEWVLEL